MIRLDPSKKILINLAAFVLLFMTAPAFGAEQGQAGQRLAVSSPLSQLGAIASPDINRDGLDDLVLHTGYHPEEVLQPIPRIAIYLNEGRTDFFRALPTAVIDLPTEAGATLAELIFKDVNSDGLTDVGIVARDNGFPERGLKLIWLTADQPDYHTFSPYSEHALSTFDGELYPSKDAAWIRDMDSDGKGELILDYCTEYYVNPFVSSASFCVERSLEVVRIADDGIPDSEFTLPGVRIFDVTDFNNDGVSDLVLVNDDNMLSVIYLGGAVSESVIADLQSYTDITHVFGGRFLGGDALPDIVLAGENRRLEFRQVQSGIFEFETEDDGTFPEILSAEVADYDGNGYEDIAVAGYDESMSEIQFKLLKYRSEGVETLSALLEPGVEFESPRGRPQVDRLHTGSLQSPDGSEGYYVSPRVVRQCMDETGMAGLEPPLLTNIRPPMLPYQFPASHDRSETDFLLYGQFSNYVYSTVDNAVEPYVETSRSRVSGESFFGDVNLDGYPDYLSRTFCGVTVSLNRSGTMTPGPSSNMVFGPVCNTDFSLHDWNGDGYPDLTALDIQGDNVRFIYYAANDGTGRFDRTAGGPLVTGLNLPRCNVPAFIGVADNNDTDLKLVDIDGDGHTDICLNVASCGQMEGEDYAIGLDTYLFYNDGNDAFGAPVMHSSTRYYDREFQVHNAFEVADMDGNGMMDILRYFGELESEDAEYPEYHAEILLQSSPGVFEPFEFEGESAFYISPFHALRNPLPVMADLDGDTRTDLLFHQIHNGRWDDRDTRPLIRMEYDGTFFQTDTLREDSNAVYYLPADIDGDGLDDIVMVRNVDNHTGVYREVSWTPAFESNDTVNTGAGDLIAEPLGLYPNPATSRLTIRAGDMHVESNASSFTIADMSGQIVQAGMISGLPAELNVESLPPGVYFLRIHRNGMQGPASGNGKFIVMPYPQR